MRRFLGVAALAACFTVSAPAWPDGGVPVGGVPVGGGSVTIDNFTFSPGKLLVAKRTEVTWTNRDDIPHSIVLGKLAVRSKALDTDGSFSYRFDRTGTFGYVCGLHPQMRGEVVVR